jgi:putative addiction module component (TIGR02574 family)
MSDVRERLEGLSVEEKYELLDALWASLEDEELEITEAQRAELDRRTALFEANPADVIPWEQVRVELFRRA